MEYDSSVSRNSVAAEIAYRHYLYSHRVVNNIEYFVWFYIKCNKCFIMTGYKCSLHKYYPCLALAHILNIAFIIIRSTCINSIFCCLHFNSTRQTEHDDDSVCMNGQNVHLWIVPSKWCYCSFVISHMHFFFCVCMCVVCKYNRSYSIVMHTDQLPAPVN